MDVLIAHLSNNWPMWAVSVTLVVAAVIDGMYLKVPNKITYPLIVTGWCYSLATGGLVGLGWSLASTFSGLALRFGLPLSGGRGAGAVVDTRVAPSVGPRARCRARRTRSL